MFSASKNDQVSTEIILLDKMNNPVRFTCLINYSLADEVNPDRVLGKYNKLIIKQMGRFLNKHKQEIGMSPDELVFRGEHKVDQIRIRVIDFNATYLEEKIAQSVSELLPYKHTETVTWINVDGLHDTALMEALAEGFDLDILAISEVLNTQSRSKIQEYENCLFISIKMLQYDEEKDFVNIENLSLVVTESVIISFQERKGDVFEPVRERIRKQKKKIRNSGTDYLIFALLDIVIDNYIYILSVIGEEIEALEDALLLDPEDDVIHEINLYKRELNFIRRNIKPAKEMIIALSKLETELIEDSTDIHIKELQDNINQASDSSDNYREILSDQLNIYHTTITSKLNDIMKFLTVFSAIFIPLTFIAGIYGTNFDVVPELHYRYSYFIMWGVMLLLAASMLMYFRIKKWL